MNWFLVLASLYVGGIVFGCFLVVIVSIYRVILMIHDSMKGHTNARVEKK